MSSKDKIIDFRYICGYPHHHFACNAAVRSPGGERLNYQNYRIFGVVGLPAPDSHVQNGFGSRHQFHCFT